MFEVPIKFKFFEKLKLYNDFVSKESIFQEKLWDECQYILNWSASPKHKYIGTFLNKKIVCRIFGIERDLFQGLMIASDKTKEDKLNRLKKLKDFDEELKKNYAQIIESMSDGEINKNELEKKLILMAIEKSQVKNYFNDEFIKKVIKKTIEQGSRNIDQAIKNLHAMGFGDLNEKADAIRINQKGFLMGELIIEINRKNFLGIWNKIKYLFSIWFLRFFIFLLIIYSSFLMIDFVVKFFYEK